MTQPLSPDPPGPAPSWYVCDLSGLLLRTEASLEEACRWAMAQSGTTATATRQQITADDYWYVFVDPLEVPCEYQARILRSDRACHIGLSVEY